MKDAGGALHRVDVSERNHVAGEGIFDPFERSVRSAFIRLDGLSALDQFYETLDVQIEAGVRDGQGIRPRALARIFHFTR